MTTKTTCSKTFADLPFAHRQHNHQGHCALIHGHNWSFQIVFGAARLDVNQFVVDFGRLKWIREWLAHHFDHTLVLNQDDPALAFLRQTLGELRDGAGVTTRPPYADLVIVPNCGAEGLAQYVLEELNHILRDEPLRLASFDSLATFDIEDAQARNLRVVSVTVFEDSKNTATVTLSE